MVVSIGRVVVSIGRVVVSIGEGGRVVVSVEEGRLVVSVETGGGGEDPNGLEFPTVGLTPP